MADREPPAAPAPGASSHSLERDLLAVREARGVSFESIQYETRMPPDILRRFEAGELVGDPHYNEVYLRALLKSYAQAIGVSPQEVMRAHEAQKAGSYRGELRRLYLEGERPAPPPAAAPPPPVERRSPDPAPRTAPEPPQAPPASTPPAAPKTSAGKAPAVAALAQKPPKPAAEPARPAGPNEHYPKRRVKTAAQASATGKSLERSWGLIIGGAVAGVLVIGSILWFLFRGDEPEPELPAEPEVVAADTAEVAEPTAEPAELAATNSPAPQFVTPIQLTIVAGENALENFRVQVDDDARRPYWIEPGQSESFTAQRQVSVWGELEAGASGGGNYDGATLRLQGLEWTPPDGRVVRIDAQRGQALLDSLHRAQGAG